MKVATCSKGMVMSLSNFATTWPELMAYTTSRRRRKRSASLRGKWNDRKFINKTKPTAR